MERSIHDLVWRATSASAWRNWGNYDNIGKESRLLGSDLNPELPVSTATFSSIEQWNVYAAVIYLYSVNLLGTTIKVWKIRWTGYVACRMKSNSYNIWLKNLKGMNHWRLGMRWEYNFKTDLREQNTELWTGTEPAFDRVQSRTFMNSMMNIRLSWKQVISWSAFNRSTQILCHNYK
jgi:hypothetical protein